MMRNVCRAIVVALLVLAGFAGVAAAGPVGVDEPPEQAEEGPKVGEEGYFSHYYGDDQVGFDNIFLGNPVERVENVLDARGLDYERFVDYNYDRLRSIEREGVLQLGDAELEAEVRYLFFERKLYTINYRTTLSATREAAEARQDELYRRWMEATGYPADEFPEAETADEGERVRRVLSATEIPVSVFTNLVGPKDAEGEEEWHLLLEVVDFPTMLHVSDKVERARQSPWRMNQGE